MCASFSLSEKRKNLSKLHEAISVIEGDLHLALANTSAEESIKKFFNAKLFGTFE